MGGRLLRKWLRQPLLDVAEIFRRQDHIACTHVTLQKPANIRGILSEVKDFLITY